jgi:hypothetical protein
LGKNLRAGIKNEWIEISVSLVIIGVRFTIDRDLNIEHIWLSVLWNLAFNKSGACQSGFREDVFIWVVSETAEKITALIIVAGETSSTDLNDLILSSFNVTECWGNTSDMWCSIEDI